VDLTSQTHYLRDEVKAARALIGELDAAAAGCLSFRDKAQEVSEEGFRALSRLEQVCGCNRTPCHSLRDVTSRSAGTRFCGVGGGSPPRPTRSPARAPAGHLHA
jgi:hypothetical protein